jgi:hypothetical protein
MKLKALNLVLKSVAPRRPWPEWRSVPTANAQTTLMFYDIVDKLYEDCDVV